MSRSDQYSVSLIVGGTNLGVWDSLSGGTADSDESKHRAGGLGPEKALGGAPTTENVTVARLYDLNRDHANYHWLLGQRGRGSATVVKQPLDLDGNAFGRPVVYTGIVKSVQAPEHDSTSSDPGMITVEISTDASIG